MDPGRDPYSTLPPPRGWRWKTIDIVALLILLVVVWPLGLAFLVWKLWNDRQPDPQDLETLLRGAGARIEALAERLGGALDDLWSGSGRRAPTGNAAFDAYVRQKEALLATQRQALDDEIEAFRRFMAHERHDDRDLYERFRSTRSGPVG
jgi:hypothetical protein